MFQDDCKLWKRKPAVQKTWAQFKVDFSIAHTELVEFSQTARSSGYQANNATAVQQETVAAISNLANATQADRESTASLTSPVTTLTTDLSSANDKLVKALARITVLEKELAAAKLGQPGATTPNKGFSKIHYCSTHGP